MPANARSAPPRLVLDAGPLIALFHDQDPDHEAALRGFTVVAARRSQLVTPLPVVFEVYKWLLYNGGYQTAQRGFREMRTALSIIDVRVGDLDAIGVLTQAVRGWRGTLEDVLVALTALRLRAPVWTLNYRDLSAFPRLTFWNP